MDSYFSWNKLFEFINISMVNLFYKNIQLFFLQDTTWTTGILINGVGYLSYLYRLFGTHSLIIQGKQGIGKQAM